jgi:hypothetical protein
MAGNDLGQFPPFSGRGKRLSRRRQFARKSVVHLPALNVQVVVVVTLESFTSSRVAVMEEEQEQRDVAAAAAAPTSSISPGRLSQGLELFVYTPVVFIFWFFFVCLFICLFA